MFKPSILILLVAVVQFSSCAIIDLATATLTTLPPASPTESDPCGFTDRISLLDRIESEWQDYNVSLLVEKCATVCPLMYGSGNPDISGVGAMVSYGIQGLLTFIFGPVLAILVLVLRFHVDPSGNRLVKSMAKLSATVYQGNVFLTLATYVASVIRITKAPPLAELSFMQWLAIYQFFIIMGATVCYTHTLGFNTRRDVVTSLYASVVLILFFVVVSMNGYPSSKAEILRQITIYCVTKRDYSLSSGKAPRTKEEARQETSFYLICFGSIIGAIILGPVIWNYVKWVRTLIKRAYAKLSGYFQRFCTFLGTTPDRFGVIIGVSFATVYWLSYSILFLFIMQSQRRDLQLSAGYAYQDSEWGFGQVTVLILWLPLVHDMLFECYELYRPEHPEAALRSSSEIELLPVQNQAQHTPGAPSMPTHSNAVTIPIGSTDIVDNAMARMSSDTLVEDGIRDLQTEPRLTQNNAQVQDSVGSSTLAASRQVDVGGSQSIAMHIMRSSSNDVFDESSVFDVTHRVTWPRNESGTYLPAGPHSSGAETRR